MTMEKGTEMLKVEEGPRARADRSQNRQKRESPRELQKGACPVDILIAVQ